MHKLTLDPTGYCAAAQAWWVPKFRCPECASPLQDNGYCANCTPKTQVFPGDFFEPAWDESAGPAYGHFIRRYRGPTPAPTEVQVQTYLAELKALVNTVADRLDANGTGISRRLRRCGCDQCAAHFRDQPTARDATAELDPEMTARYLAVVRARQAQTREPGDEPAWVTEPDDA